LYLVTRNSPNLSQAIWENFQPDQLFPESAHVPLFQPMSPSQAHANLDAHVMSGVQMQGQQGGQNGPFDQQQQGQQQSPHMQHGSLANNNGNGNNANNGGGHGLWQSLDTAMVDGQSPSDSWSTGSVQGQPVPATLNVEDW
jgi:hypothetical protein